LIPSALKGDINAIARLISLSEAGGETALQVQDEIFQHTGKAHLLGITGPAGAGKSTLIGKLAGALAAAGKKVGVLACDPSSPRSGGALLGDRIRMSNLTHEPRVFIRSIATRGSSGGLPLAAFRAADILDACGFDIVIIETVGTGQNQLDIMQAAHSIIVVSAPGLGDGIQAMKSGLLEVADIHIISKIDLEGSSRTLEDIKTAVHMRLPVANPSEEQATWSPPVLPLNSLSGEGMDALIRTISEHYHYLENSGNMQQCCQHIFQQRIYREAIEILSQSFREKPDEESAARLDQVIQRKITPTRAAQESLRKLL